MIRALLLASWLWSQLPLGPAWLNQTEHTRQLAPGLQYTLICRGYRETNEGCGPWRIHVLDVAPGRAVVAALATEEVSGLEPLSALAGRHRALAAVNGGYFVMDGTQGTPGDLAGLSVLDGQLLSEGVGQRGALLLGGSGPRIARLASRLTVTLGEGAARVLNGLNRPPGRVRSGGQEAESGWDAVRHDCTARPPDEVVQYLPIYGQDTPSDAECEAVVRQGRVVELRQGGGPIPEDGSVLAAIGEGARWLRAEARPGVPVNVECQVLAEGQKLSLAGLSVINGGPLLLRNGRDVLDAEAEGFAWSAEFLEQFGYRRHPRTLAGITAQGHLLLVVVDGRDPDRSVGLTFEESTALMRALGAVDAVNLDGGGSSTMMVGDELVNAPSDSTGERPIGDAVLVLP